MKDTKTRLRNNLKILMAGSEMTDEKMNAVMDIMELFSERSVVITGTAKKESRLKTNGTSRRFMPYTEDEDEFIRQNYKKIPTKRIAKNLCRTPKSIILRAFGMGLSKKIILKTDEPTNPNS